MMAREVYTDKKFIEFSRNQVFLRVFEDTQPEGKRLSERFGIVGFPTLIILNSRGQEVDRIIGALPAGDLIEELQIIFESERSEPISI
jgi:thiol:disulfide interchange protein